jgi:hypothetical protein
LERGLEGWDESLKFLKGQTREIQELCGAGLHIGEPDTGHTWCLLSWEAQYTIIGINSIIVYYPGKKFFHDQEAKAARRQLAEEIDTWQSATSSPQLDLMERSDLLLADILVTCGDKQNTAAYLIV